jgi:hypothetical protein
VNTLDSVDLASPLDRALFRDAYREIHGLPASSMDSLLLSFERERQASFSDPERKVGGGRQRLTLETLTALVPMYLEFLAVYAGVLCLTFFGGRGIAIYRFAATRRDESSFLRMYIREVERNGPAVLFRRLDLPARAIIRGVAYLILFAPAYVIAYSLRTRVDTENVFFLVILAVASNGLLITYANKFFTLLVTESRKGYVETALVKGLSSSYAMGSRDGLPWAVLIDPRRAVHGHVFRHIYLNARFQHLTSVKEQVSLLVTSLVIIEMALNIRGYLCYALLQHILFREYDIALAIVFGIFLAVKATEIAVDLWHFREARRYGNEE